MRALLLTAILLLAGCSEAPAPEVDEGLQGKDVDPSKGLGAISGVIVSETIVPIAGATVTIVQTGVSVVSDEGGLFVFEDLEPGNYFLEISAPGYTTIQASAEVLADEVTKPRILLQADFSPVPYSATIAHNGFIQFSPGIAGFVIEIVAGDLVGLCDCSLEWTPDPGAKTYVMDVVYEENLQSPAGHAGFYWEFWSDEEGVTGYGHSPINVAAGAEQFGQNASMLARLTGPDEWVVMEQTFEMFVTTFYLEAAPAGWSAIQ